MLANLDNEVHFKNVFTDVEIFSAFTKDILGIDLTIDKVETEKVLPRIEDTARKDVAEKMIKKSLKRRKLSLKEIAEDFELSIDDVKAIKERRGKEQ